jgi:hypothetical protein
LDVGEKRKLNRQNTKQWRVEVDFTAHPWPKERPPYAVFHEKWQPFPVPTTLREAGGITVAARDIRWRWAADANRTDTSGHVHVTLTPINS